MPVPGPTFYHNIGVCEGGAHVIFFFKFLNTPVIPDVLPGLQTSCLGFMPL